MAYGSDGLSAQGMAFYEKIRRSVKATNFEEEECVDLWNEIWKKEMDNHVKGKCQTKGVEMWKKSDPEQDTTENLFEDGN